MNHSTSGPPCPSPTPGVYSDSCPLSRWCHPAISSPVVPFSSRPQSFPASGSFPMSQLLASGGQKYWSFSFSISPSSEHPGLISFRMDWLDLLAVQGLSGVFSNTTNIAAQKAQWMEKTSFAFLLHFHSAACTDQRVRVNKIKSHPHWNLCSS